MIQFEGCFTFSFSLYGLSKLKKEIEVKLDMALVLFSDEKLRFESAKRLKDKDILTSIPF